MPQNPDICMIVHNDVRHDSRVRKEATSLASQGWDVLVVGIMLGDYADIPLEETVNGFRIKRVHPPFRATGTLKKIIQLIITLPLVFLALRKANARAYHGHDFVGLFILALAGIWNKPIVYDSHELFFERSVKKTFWHYLYPIEKVIAQRSQKVVVTSQSHGEFLSKTLGIPQPVLVRNLVDLRIKNDKHSVVSYNLSDKKVIVHSGNMTSGRHLSELISALNYLPDEFVLVLMGDGSLKEKLIEQAEQDGTSDKLKIVAAVSPDEVVITLSQADVGLALITAKHLSYYYSLPNKILESIGAGLPVLTSKNPELERLVTHYDIGLTCDPTDPESIADAIKEMFIPETYQRFRENVEKARLELTWEQEEKKLIAVYKEIFQENEVF